MLPLVEPELLVELGVVELGVVELEPFAFMLPEALPEALPLALPEAEVSPAALPLVVSVLERVDLLQPVNASPSAMSVATPVIFSFCVFIIFLPRIFSRARAVRVLVSSAGTAGGERP